MTENPHQTAPPGAPSEPAPDPEQRHAWATVSPLLAGRPLQRGGRGERKVAGVCSGLARWLDVDPLLVRVAMVVLALFGGSGVLIYGLAWLLVPEEGHQRSEASEALHGRSGAGLVGAIVLVLLGVFVFGGVFGVGTNGGPSLAGLVTLAVLGAAVVFAVRDGGRRPAPPLTDAPRPLAPDAFGRSAGTAYSAPPPVPAEVGDQTVVLPVPTADDRTAAGSATDPTLDPGQGSPMSQTTPLPPAAGPALPPTGDLPPYAPYRYLPPPVPPRPRERSRLGRTTFSLALLAAGAVIGWGIVTGDGDYGPLALAAALGVTGLGLVVGAFAGRARGLIALGLVLTLLFGAASLAQAAFGTSAGGRTWAPTSAADTEREYDLGVGSAVLDLSKVRPAGPLDVTANIGLGELVVTVPREVAVQVRTKVGGGEVRLPDGTVTSGTGLERSWSAPAAQTPTAGPGGTLVLDLEVGLGNLEVRRAAS